MLQLSESMVRSGSCKYLWPDQVRPSQCLGEARLLASRNGMLLEHLAFRGHKSDTLSDSIVDRTEQTSGSANDLTSNHCKISPPLPLFKLNHAVMGFRHQILRGRR